MLQSFDLFTLGFCSVLASTAFGSVFFTLWLRRPGERHLLHWAMSNWTYVLALVGLYFAAAWHPAMSLSLFVLIGLSDVLVVSGVNRLDAEQSFHRWMIVPIAAPAIGHLVQGLAPLVGLPLFDMGETIGLSIAMGSCGFALLREGPSFSSSRGRRIAACALIAYLPGYAAIIVIRLWFPQANELTQRIPLLADQILLGILNLGLLAIPTERAHQRLREAASRDPLTEAWNRKGLEHLAPQLMKRDGAVIAIDVDHFKSINDEYGHGAGDKVLLNVARAAQRIASKRNGAVFRVGGDEFILILPDCSLADARGLSSAVRLYQDDRLPDWTASIGVALIDDEVFDVASAIRQADEALYRAKAEGRNRAFIATYEPPPGKPGEVSWR